MLSRISDGTAGRSCDISSSSSESDTPTIDTGTLPEPNSLKDKNCVVGVVEVGSPKSSPQEQDSEIQTTATVEDSSCLGHTSEPAVLDVELDDAGVLDLQPDSHIPRSSSVFGCKTFD